MGAKRVRQRENDLFSGRHRFGFRKTTHERRKTTHARRKTTRERRKTSHERRKTTHERRKTSHVRRKTTHVRRKTTHVRRKTTHARRTTAHARRTTSHGRRTTSHGRRTPKETIRSPTRPHLSLRTRVAASMARSRAPVCRRLRRQRNDWRSGWQHVTDVTLTKWSSPPKSKQLLLYHGAQPNIGWMNLVELAFQGGTTPPHRVGFRR